MEPEKRPTFNDINLRLDIILINAAIRNSEASTFWTSSFGFKRPDHMIEWEEFIDFFCEYLSLPSPYEAKLKGEEIDKHYWSNIICLKQVLVTRLEKKEHVQIERFGQVVNWFGPLKQTEARWTILDNIRYLLKQKWFHGDISSAEATKKVSRSPPGTFLVRFSTNAMGAFTSTIQTDKGVLHVRIFRNAQGKFYLSNEKDKTFATLHDLIEMHDSFSTPCDDWPYASCFPSSKTKEFMSAFKEKNNYVKKGYVFSMDEVDTKLISKARKLSRKKKKEKEAAKEMEEEEEEAKEKDQAETETEAENKQEKEKDRETGKEMNTQEKENKMDTGQATKQGHQSEQTVRENGL